MLDPFFPQTIDTEDTYDDFSVTVVKQFDLSVSKIVISHHCLIWVSFLSPITFLKERSICEHLKHYHFQMSLIPFSALY